ncbi:MAG: VOC family protein, partial [Brasilonema angustatum HA4187-MV1]|nr:VOC family protein [Brasilonema angustatum HA4187-MV1]
MVRNNNIHVQRIRAIGLTVTDSDRSLNFYTQALGFKVVSDITVAGQNYSELEDVETATIRIITLKLGDELIELMEYLNVEGKLIPSDSQSNDLWFQHFAITVSNMDRAYAHLRSFPIKPISVEPQTIPPDNEASAGVRAFKFKDPDGHNLELIWFPADKGQDKWHQDTENLFLGIDHSAITISKTDQSLKFYRDTLGMQIDGGSLNQGETQAHLDGLPQAEVRVTPLRPIQGGLGIEMLDYIVPGNGRPMPSDWKSSDTAHIQLELVVNDIRPLAKVRENKVGEFLQAIARSADAKGVSPQNCNKYFLCLLQRVAKFIIIQTCY